MQTTPVTVTRQDRATALAAPNSFHPADDWNWIHTGEWSSSARSTQEVYERHELEALARLAATERVKREALQERIEQQARGLETLRETQEQLTSWRNKALEARAELAALRSDVERVGSLKVVVLK